MPPAAPRTVTLEFCDNTYQLDSLQETYIGIGGFSINVIKVLETYLAGRRREAAARGLGEYLAGGEHCDGRAASRDGRW
jgi:hypothetical protein